jgi:hypothetical protein
VLELNHFGKPLGVGFRGPDCIISTISRWADVAGAADMILLVRLEGGESSPKTTQRHTSEPEDQELRMQDRIPLSELLPKVVNTSRSHYLGHHAQERSKDRTAARKRDRILFFPGAKTERLHHNHRAREEVSNRSPN